MISCICFPQHLVLRVLSSSPFDRSPLGVLFQVEPTGQTFQELMHVAAEAWEEGVEGAEPMSSPRTVVPHHVS